MAEGLLDFLKTPEGQGLLSGVFGYAANARQGTPWNNLGRGGVAGLMGYGNALERQDTLAQREQAKKLQDLQAQHYQMQIESAKRADEIAKGKQAALSTLYTGGVEARPAFTPIGDSPLVPMPAVEGRAPTLDWRKALEKNFTVDEITKLATLPDVGKPEVARTEDVEGPKGEKMRQNYDKWGRKVGDPFMAYVAPEKNDTGSSIIYEKPRAGLTFQKTMTPGEVASNQVALGNLGVAQGNLALSRQRFAFDQSGGADANKWTFNADAGGWIKPPSATAPTGSVIKMDGMNPKMTEDQAKASGWLVQATNAYGNMAKAMQDESGVEQVGGADVIASLPGFSGLGNSMRSKNRQMFVQGASSLSEALLRAATGAGQNADEARQKIEELTPVFGEHPDTTKQKMAAIPLYIESLKMRAGPGAKNAESVILNADPQSGATNPQKAPMKGQVVDGYKFKGGDPSNPANWEKQ